MEIIKILLWVIAGFCLSIILLVLVDNFKYWCIRKFTFVSIGLKLIFNKNKVIRNIGWQSIKLFLWE